MRVLHVKRRPAPNQHLARPPTRTKFELGRKVRRDTTYRPIAA